MRRGFTLLEILVALAILAIVSVSVFRSGGNTVRQLSGIEQRTLARWVAENEVAQIRLERWRDDKKKRDKIYAARSKPSTSADGGDPIGKPKQLSLGSGRRNVKLGDRTWQVVRDVQSASHRDMRRVDVQVYVMERGRRVGPVDTLTAFVGRY